MCTLVCQEQYACLSYTSLYLYMYDIQCQTLSGQLLQVDSFVGCVIRTSPAQYV